MDSKRFELPENENSCSSMEPAYTSFKLLRELAKAGGHLDPATQDVITRNLDEDAKHYRELTFYNKEQVFRYYKRRDWHTLIKVLLIIAYNLACICFTSGQPNPYFMACSNSAIGAIALRDKFRNLPIFNNRTDQKK